MHDSTSCLNFSSQDTLGRLLFWGGMTADMADFLALLAQSGNMKSSEKRNIRIMIRSLMPRFQLSDKRVLNVTNIRILFQFRKFFNGFPALKSECPHVSRSLNSSPDTSIAADIGAYYKS